MGTSATRHYTLSLHDALPIFPELSARTKACTAQKPACCILPWVQAHPEIKKPDRHKRPGFGFTLPRSEEHTSELQSRPQLVCRLLLETKTGAKSVSQRGSNGI